VPGTSAAPLREKDAVTPDTEAQIATATPVLVSVRTATHSHASYPALADRITVDAPPNTNVLSISFSATRPKVATEGAQAAAIAFIALRARLIDDRQAADIAALNAQIDALNGDLATAATDTISGGPTNRASARITQEVVTSKIRTLQRAQLRLTLDKPAAGTVLRPAVATAARPRLGREVPITSGLLVGLLIGLLLGRVRPRRFLSARDLQQAATGADPVDVIAVSVAGGGRRRSRSRRSSLDPGLGRLRNVTVAGGGGLTVVTGPARRSVTATIEAGLARTLARVGQGVAVLVSEDDAPLLAALRFSPESLRDMDRDPVATGLAAPEHGDIVAYRLRAKSDATAAAATLRRSYPHVLVPAPGEPDARVCAIARTADRVVVAAEQRQTHVRDVVDTIRRLRLVGAPVTTTLLVRGAR
jgi:hypothetical protein